MRVVLKALSQIRVTALFSLLPSEHIVSVEMLPLSVDRGSGTQVPVVEHFLIITHHKTKSIFRLSNIRVNSIDTRYIP